MTRDTWQRLKSDRYGMCGLIVVAVFALLAVCVWSGLLGQGWSEVSGNQWQNRAGCRACNIKLRFNKAFAAVGFAPLHETLPALNTLTVAPFVGDM